MPDVVHLGYRQWKVRRKTIPDDGNVLYDQQLVLVRTGQKPDDEANSLLHEILHVICHEERLFPGEDEKEEQAVTVITNRLCELWWRNPALVRYIDDSLRRGDA